MTKEEIATTEELILHCKGLSAEAKKGKNPSDSDAVKFFDAIAALIQQQSTRIADLEKEVERLRGLVNTNFG